MRTLLVVDDDPILHKSLALAFAPEFRMVFCATIAEAMQAIDREPEITLAIVDRRLPDGDGLSLLSELRRRPRSQSLPAIFLSGLTSESDRISGFFAGADDYVTKPFSVLELKARVQARLRALGSNRMAVGAIEIDLDAHRAHSTIGGARSEIALTRTEFKILVVLAQSLGSVIPRETLLARIWGDDTHVSDRVIDSHVSHLRKKIAGCGLALEPLRGEGYRLDLDPSGAHRAS